MLICLKTYVGSELVGSKKANLPDIKGLGSSSIIKVWAQTDNGLVQSLV